MPKSNNSVESLLANTRSYLKEISERAKVRAELPNVSFWLVMPSLLEAIEQEVEIKDISEIKPNSRVNIDLEFTLGDIGYRFVIKTIVNQNGVFTLRYSDITDINFPYADEKSLWEGVKEYAKENAPSLAGLMLSLLNTGLDIMRLKPF